MYENFHSKKLFKIDDRTDWGEPSKGSECGETKSERCFRKIHAATLRRAVGGEEDESLKKQFRDDENPNQGSGHGNRQRQI